MDEGSECDGHVRVQRRGIEHDACRERQAHRRPASTTFPRRCRDGDAAPLTHVSLHLWSRGGMREGRSTASTRVLRSLLHSKFLFTLFAFPFSLILLSFTVLTSTWLSYLTSDWSGGIIFDRLMSIYSRAGRERARGSAPPLSLSLSALPPCPRRPLACVCLGFSAAPTVPAATHLRARPEEEERLGFTHARTQARCP